MAEQVDAVVVGAGHNGLVAAARLADAGWDVLVLEQQGEVGGAVRSAELWPGATADLFSAFYPLTAASPVVRRLHLEDHGLRWEHAPAVLAHLADPADEACALLERDPAATAARLDAAAPGDGAVWLDLVAQWQRIRDPLLQALFSPLPPVVAVVRLLRRAGTATALRLARTALLPATRMGEELFTGAHARRLLAGNAAHADVPLDAAGSGIYGWLLLMLAQDVGFPVPRGGAGQLAAAMAARAAAAGARVETSQAVTSVVVHAGRAVGVRTAGGRTVLARRAVLADVPAPMLFDDLVGREHLPPAAAADLDRFQWDLPTAKLNWLVDGGIPWTAREAARAGTVHLGTGAGGLARWSADLGTGRTPDRTFLLLGQMSTADPSRSPDGTETAWAYSHLPRGRTDDAAVQGLVDAMQDTVERFAPGFGDRVLGRVVQTPGDLQAADAALHTGAIAGGTAQLHQQLVFRPFTGLGRPETPVDRLYLAGASAHPGGGVHGACGWIAATAALRAEGPLGPVRRGLTRRLQATLYDPGARRALPGDSSEATRTLPGWGSTGSPSPKRRMSGPTSTS